MFNGLNILLIITAFINLKHLLNVKFYSWFVIQITTNDLRNLSAANLLRQCGIVDRRLTVLVAFSHRGLLNDCFSKLTKFSLIRHSRFAEIILDVCVDWIRSGNLCLQGKTSFIFYQEAQSGFNLK